MTAAYKLLFTIITTCAAVTPYEDCVFSVKHGENYLHFDLNNLKNFKTTNFTNLYSINIELCKSNEQITYCAGMKSKICLINKNKNLQLDIGSRIKEMTLDVKNQLIMSLQGNTICEKNRMYTTYITFVCSRNNNEDKFINKPNVDQCIYIIELISIVACPVDDLDMRKICSDVSIPHSNYKFNLSPLRRLTNNYLVENQNRRFELNICGRLINSNDCGTNITTICDITDAKKSKVYAVFSKNDKLIYDTESQSLKLVQHERVSKKRGKRIEIIFKCNESIPVEDTKPEFLSDDYYLHNSNNVAHFKVATSVVCFPRIILCEIFTNTVRFNLKPLHKRIGNLIVPNEIDGGKFHLNVCGYLNQYGEKIPTSCSAGKTSVCFEYSPGKGISIGSTQIGPYYAGNLILLNYTDGEYCKNSLKWSTVIKFTCSDESQLIHHFTNSNLCIYVFHWKSREACSTSFERKDQCMVTNPQYSNVFNMSYLKDQSFEINDYENNGKFLFSICSPLQTPCNGYLNSAACWSLNGIEKNIGFFNEEIVFDNGKIYLSMQGEKCDNNGPNSLTSIRFICDYSDSKKIDFKKNLQECSFEFFIYTKHACTPPKKVNCSVNDKSGNIFDLSKLTKLNSNYELTINQKQKIIFNVCHSVINNDKNEINCQFNSGVCLVDNNHELTFKRYKNLGDVNESPSKEGNKIILEMTNGFYDGKVVSSVIEFICSETSSGTNISLFINKENDKYTFKWYTPFVCPSTKKREMTLSHNAISKLKHLVQVDESKYTIYICPKKYEAGSDCNLGESDLNYTEYRPAIIINVNGMKMKKYLNMELNFCYDSLTICDYFNNQTKKINFRFMCGIELQMPKIEKKECITNVLIIDPEMCDKKLECKVKSRDLTPIKGSYVIINKRVKYFINFCKVGKEGTGGQMELNGKNYSMGYQVSSPISKVRDTVEIDYKYGDDCYFGESTFYTKKFSTKIRVICDVTEANGVPIFKETKDKCSLEFEWKTSFLCPKKMIDFNMLLCAATFVDFHNDFDGPKMINMSNILNIHEFYDNATKIIYYVNFCNEYGISSNTLHVFGNMSLQYDIYKKQLIASFKSIHDSTNMNIVITCSNFTEKLPVPEVLSTVIQTTIYTYSEGICCLDEMYHTNEMCKNYLLTHVSTTTLKTTTIIEDGLFTDFQNYESSDNLEYLKSSDLEKPTLLDIKQIKKLNMNTFDSDTNLPQNEGKTKNFDNITSMQDMEKNVSSTSFNYSGIIHVVLILVSTSILWFYRMKLMNELRKLLNYLSLMAIRRRRRSTY